MEWAGGLPALWLGRQLPNRLKVSALRKRSPTPYLGGMAKPTKKAPKSLILGVGLDSDGHKRVTTGPNFALVGGSKETHEEMTEKAVKINEKLSAKGKTLETVSSQEFDDIAHAVGLKRHAPDRN